LGLNSRDFGKTKKRAESRRVVKIELLVLVTLRTSFRR